MPTLGVFAQGSAAKLFLPVKVVEASSITTGYLATLLTTSLSFDGNQAVMPASGTAGPLPGFIGVAAADIASNGYGLVQCWGMTASVFMSQYGTSVTVNIGDPMVPGAGKGGAGSAVPTYLNAGFKYIVSSGTPLALSQALNYNSGLVRCL